MTRRGTADPQDIVRCMHWESAVVLVLEPHVLNRVHMKMPTTTQELDETDDSERHRANRTNTVQDERGARREELESIQSRYLL